MKDGVFFLDRDPSTFKVILSYLRNGELKPSIAENQYLILLYLWDIGNQYDALIGVKTLSSFGIKN